MVVQLLKRYTNLNVADYASLLRLTGEYRLAELRVEPGDWLDGGTLAEARPREEGVSVLGVRRPDGTFIGNPTGDTRVAARDTLVIYGRVTAIQRLDRREKGTFGDVEHNRAVREQEKVVSEEADKDPT